jgi:cadmium resistance protein CadD (predicted permease)
VFPLLAVTMLTFVGTALDNLLMLTMLRASGTPAVDIGRGFLAGSALVLALCAAGTGLASVLPHHYLGYLGAVPVLIGLTGLVGAIRGGPAESAAPSRTGAPGIAALQIAASFDSIAAFLPLFADTERPFGLVVAAGFAAMTVLWLLISSTLARVPGIASALRPVERYARPTVLILVGLYVLANTSTDLEPDAAAGAAGMTRAVTHLDGCDRFSCPSAALPPAASRS